MPTQKYKHLVSTPKFKSEKTKKCGCIDKPILWCKCLCHPEFKKLYEEEIKNGKRCKECKRLQT